MVEEPGQDVPIPADNELEWDKGMRPRALRPKCAPKRRLTAETDSSIVVQISSGTHWLHDMKAHVDPFEQLEFVQNIAMPPCSHSSDPSTESEVC